MKRGVWLAASMMALTAPASGQMPEVASKLPEATEAELKSSAGVAYSCVSRRITNGGADPFDFSLPLPSANSAEGSGARGKANASGYSPAACAVDIAHFKKMMCFLAQGNDAVQLRIAQILGMTGVELCAIGKTLLPDAAAAALP